MLFVYPGNLQPIDYILQPLLITTTKLLLAKAPSSLLVEEESGKYNFPSHRILFQLPSGKKAAR